MHDKCSAQRDAINTFLEQGFAARDDDVWRAPRNELLRLFAVGAGSVQHGYERTQMRVIGAHLSEPLFLPPLIAGSVHQAVIQAECQYIRKPRNTNSFDFAENAFPHPTIGLM